MKYLLVIAGVLWGATSAKGQDSIAFRKIADQILLHGKCYDDLRVLCKTVGNRISGSKNAEKAVAWGYNTMKNLGADTVWLQPADVPMWVRGKESLLIKQGNGTFKKVPILSLGNSEGTGGKPIDAEIIMVPDFEAFQKLSAEAVKGKVIFFNYRFRQDFVFTFNGYGDAVKYRGAAPSVAAAKGAAGIIIRSMSTGADDFPHTGATHYNDSFAKIPAMAVGNYTADSLERYCTMGKVYGRMQLECTMHKALAKSYNVIAEIKGSKYPDRIIVVGGHLDSWDVGEGAHDDGAGCVQSMEVIRTFHNLGIRPAYTVRAVLFMNEENGLRGGKAYADSADARNEHHSLAIETDAGGFTPRGIGLEMNPELKEKVKLYRQLFLPYGIHDFEQEEGGADISPLQRRKVPVAGLLPDSQRYFDVHHTNNDVFETVNHRELKLGAVALTQFIYLVSTHEIFP